MVSWGLWVLGFVCKFLVQIFSIFDFIVVEDNLVWLGMVGMLDVFWLEVWLVVEKFFVVGICIVMIIGDYFLMVLAIVKDLGIN